MMRKQMQRDQDTKEEGKERNDRPSEGGDVSPCESGGKAGVSSDANNPAATDTQGRKRRLGELYGNSKAEQHQDAAQMTSGKKSELDPCKDGVEKDATAAGQACKQEGKSDATNRNPAMSNAGDGVLVACAPQRACAATEVGGARRGGSPCGAVGSESSGAPLTTAAGDANAPHDWDPAILQTMDANLAAAVTAEYKRLLSRAEMEFSGITRKGRKKIAKRAVAIATNKYRRRAGKCKEGLGRRSRNVGLSAAGMSCEQGPALTSEASTSELQQQRDELHEQLRSVEDIGDDQHACAIKRLNSLVATIAERGAGLDFDYALISGACPKITSKDEKRDDYMSASFNTGKPRRSRDQGDDDREDRGLDPEDVFTFEALETSFRGMKLAKARGHDNMPLGWEQLRDFIDAPDPDPEQPWARSLGQTRPTLRRTERPDDETQRRQQSPQRLGAKPGEQSSVDGPNEGSSASRDQEDHDLATGMMSCLSDNMRSCKHSDASGGSEIDNQDDHERNAPAAGNKEWPHEWWNRRKQQMGQDMMLHPEESTWKEQSWWNSSSQPHNETNTWQTRGWDKAQGKAEAPLLTKVQDGGLAEPAMWLRSKEDASNQEADGDPVAETDMVPPGVQVNTGDADSSDDGAAAGLQRFAKTDAGKDYLQNGSDDERQDAPKHPWFLKPPPGPNKGGLGDLQMEIRKDANAVCSISNIVLSWDGSR